MFTGIIEQTGEVVAIRSSADQTSGRRIIIHAASIAEGAKHGASIAVNGVCLTVAGVVGSRLEFDVIAETLARTTLGSLQPGQKVNLEPSLKVGDRLDGHFVQGHVEGTARVTRRQGSPAECVIWLRPPDDLMRFVIPKGSIALDGVSLTVASLRGGEFSVALIPTTLRRTTLGELAVGRSVNVETDILVRTVVHSLETLNADRPAPFEGTLQEQGFL